MKLTLLLILLTALSGCAMRAPLDAEHTERLKVCGKPNTTQWTECMTYGD